MRKRLQHLPPALAATGLLLAVAALVGAVMGGLQVALGAAVGVALVALSFTASSAVLAWADIVDRKLIMPVGMLTYFLKFTLFGALLLVVGATGWAGTKAVGLGLIAGTIVWAAAQAVWVYRSRIPYVDLTES